MHGADYMTTRAEYRRTKEQGVFKKVLQWAKEDNESLIVLIVERSFADNSAEHWLTLHPASSFTGLTEHYFHIIANEQELLGSDKRLLKKKLEEYSKRLQGK